MSAPGGDPALLSAPKPHRSARRLNTDPRAVILQGLEHDKTEISKDRVEEAVRPRASMEDVLSVLRIRKKLAGEAP